MTSRYGLTEIKETLNSYFCVTPKNQVLYESTLRFLKYLKNSNHQHNSLTGTDHCYSKLSKDTQYEKNDHSVFLTLQKICRKINEKTIFLVYSGPLMIHVATPFLSDINNCFLYIQYHISISLAVF